MKKILSAFLAIAMSVSLLAGCSAPDGSDSSASASGSSSTPSASPSDAQSEERESIRIGSLKGPTTMGMVKLMSDSEKGETTYDYQVTMAGAADEITALISKGELDIAAVPCNLASILYNKTGGEIRVAAINTLGVLYVVETGDTIQSVEDLRGKTIYTTGKGTTPEYALNYVLSQNGIDPAQDVTIEFKSESTEVAALLADSTDAIAMLPQPFVTTAQAQNDKLRIALDLTEEWDKLQGEDGSALITGVLIVRNGFAEEHPEALATFLEDYKSSTEYVNANIPQAAALIAEYGIVPQAAIAEKALPLCNITYIDGEEMQNKVGGYLQVLYDQNPESVGGTLPDENFYYKK